MQLLLHGSLIGLPFAACRSHVEGIGIGVNEDAGKLAADDSAYEVAKGFVLTHIAQIGPHLGTAVAQPHGMNVTCIDECIIVTIGIAVVYSGVEGVGEAVGKHPVEFRVNGRQFLLECHYLLLHSIAAEQTVLFFGAQALECALHRHMVLLGRSCC